MLSSGKRVVVLACAIGAAAAALHGQSTDPGALYKQALRREALLRQDMQSGRTDSSGGLLLDRVRVLVGSYEDLSRLFPSSDYGDDALAQGALLAADAYATFGDAVDRTTAERLVTALSSRFPKSPLVRQASSRVTGLAGSAIASAPQAPSAAPAPSQGVPAERSIAAVPEDAATPPPADSFRPRAAENDAPTPRPSDPSAPVTLRAIRREVLPSTVRITLELDREVAFRDNRLDGPPRVYVDFPNTRAAESLKDATIPYGDGAVQRVRVGRQLDSRTRVVLDLNGDRAHSVYALYNPFRVVIDFEHTPPGAGGAALPARPADLPERPGRAPAVFAASVSARAADAARVSAPGTAAARDPVAASAPAAAPVAPPRNAAGGFSLARQLGLGLTRVVIDPGHGGHDPGARVNGLSEAAMVMDVALRLEALLEKQDIEVVLTRRGDSYVALEERAEIANRSNADIFLSIHANASTAATARGVETYFLNFATNAAAEAIAARENAGSSRNMRNLPDIVQAIALNNKLDESRDLATIVQSTLYQELRKTNRSLKNLGVKQAPFMVLVGATMPSVLTEVSFMSNRNEAALLRTERYRQQIAQALFAGIMRYQTSLKRTAPRAE